MGSHEVQFWAERQHIIIGALIQSGAFSPISGESYRREFDRRVEAGMAPSHACREAVDALLDALLEASPIVSACEVHPW